MAKADFKVEVRATLTPDSYRQLLRLYHELGNVLITMRPSDD